MRLTCNFSVRGTISRKKYVGVSGPFSKTLSLNPIYDENLRFFLPYSYPDQKSDNYDRCNDAVALNIIYEELLVDGLSDNDEKAASLLFPLGLAT